MVVIEIFQRGPAGRAPPASQPSSGRMVSWTRPDDPLSAANAVPLRPSSGHTLTLTVSSTKAVMTARSADLLPRRRPTGARADPPTLPDVTASARLSAAYDAAIACMSFDGAAAWPN